MKSSVIFENLRLKLYKAVRLGLDVLGWAEGEVRAEHREKAATLALDAALKTSASKSCIRIASEGS